MCVIDKKKPDKLEAELNRKYSAERHILQRLAATTFIIIDHSTLQEHLSCTRFPKTLHISCGEENTKYQLEPVMVLGFSLLISCFMFKKNMSMCLFFLPPPSVFH